MRVAFYAPLKPPTHPVPSGDRRMARLIMAALTRAGHRVELAHDLRSRDGDPARQAAIAARGREAAEALIRRYRARPAGERPEAWFTYHLYYKAPDWLGPAVADALAIPYLVAEASHAPKRADGPWAMGHAAAAAAIRRADAVLTLNPADAAGLSPGLVEAARLVPLKPFLDTAAFAAARDGRETARAALAARLRLDADRPWLLAVARMRPGDKLASYRLLADSLSRVSTGGARFSPSPLVGEGRGEGSGARPRAGDSPSQHPSPSRFAGPSLSHKGRGRLVHRPPQGCLGPEPPGQAGAPWHLLIVGDGPARPAVEAAFAGFPDDRLRLLGEHRPEALPAFYAAADLLVWPAVNEAYGMALLEAQAAGLPVVAGAFGGVPAILADGRTGLLTAPGDPAAFAAAIGDLLDDPARRRAMGGAAAARVAAEHDIAAAARILDAAIRRARAQAGERAAEAVR